MWKEFVQRSCTMLYTIHVDLWEKDLVKQAVFTFLCWPLCDTHMYYEHVVWKEYVQTSCNDAVIALFYVCLCVTVTVWKKSLFKQAVWSWKRAITTITLFDIGRCVTVAAWAKSFSPQSTLSHTAEWGLLLWAWGLATSCTPQNDAFFSER